MVFYILVNILIVCISLLLLYSVFSSVLLFFYKFIRLYIHSYVNLFTYSLIHFFYFFCLTCRPFGRIEQTDIRRRPDHNDAFAFVVFDDISDSIKAVKSLGSSTDINGIEVKIGYSTSSKVRTIIIILHLSI